MLRQLECVPVRVAIISVILFLSGISALLFETLWLRLSGLVFGNSVWSAALILSSFMAGLALGNAIASRSKLQRWQPLHIYAALEIAVALLGCIIVFALPHLGSWLRPLFQALWGHDTVLNALRLIISFVILLIPTTAMGLTLPVMLDDPGLRRYDFGRALGFFYGFNTLGAVVGALIGEVFLIKAFGLLGTSLLAGALNCTAAAIALIVAARSRTKVDPPVQDRHLHLAENSKWPWRLLLISFASGAFLLCLEVVWFRFLRLYIASSSTAFAVMLAVVLAGIGSGGLVSGAMSRRFARHKYFLASLLLAIAITTLLCYFLFPGPALQRKAEAFYLDRWSEITLLSLALMFGPAFLSGVMFPAVTARVQDVMPGWMNTVGLTTLFNTIGAAIGPVVGSFILLPFFGFQWALIFCAAAYALLAIAVTERASWRLTLGIVAAVIAVAVVSPRRLNEEHFANARRLFEQDGEHLVKRIEGTADTLQLMRADFLGEPYYHRLLTNAFSMSATTPASHRYMRLFAYLPLALRPEAEDALLICYGLGATADALTRSPTLRKIDIVDISREVFALADDQSGFDYRNPLHDQRVKTFVQDGRFFLQASPRQYDIITGEPPPPKVIGAVNLYTAEFFSLMRDRLKDGGIASFWLPIYQMRVDEVKAILAAFHSAFPNASVWAGPDEEWIMVGVNGATRTLDANDGLWREENIRQDLARIGIEVPEQLAALFVMDSAEMDRVTSGIAPLTDFFPKRLTDEASDTNAIHDFALTYLRAPAATRQFESSSLIDKVVPPSMRKAAAPFFAVRDERFLSRIREPNPLAALDLYLQRSRLRVPVLEILHTDEFRVAIAERTAQKEASPAPEVFWELAASALARRDIPGAIQQLERKHAAQPEPRDALLLTYLYCVSDKIDKAEAIAAGSEKTKLADWLWRKLQAEYGFRPPP